MSLERYSIASCKSAKSRIVSKIVESIHTAGGRFIKQSKGRWVEISDAAAREKVETIRLSADLRVAME